MWHPSMSVQPMERMLVAPIVHNASTEAFTRLVPTLLPRAFGDTATERNNAVRLNSSSGMRLRTRGRASADKSSRILLASAGMSEVAAP